MVDDLLEEAAANLEWAQGFMPWSQRRLLNPLILKLKEARAMRMAMFQQRVRSWMISCFGVDIAGDKTERNHRFLEEALELVQTCGCTQTEAHKLVDYVFNRPVGDPPQEVGGVMVTLSALCGANGLYLEDAATVELDRINQPEIKEKIRAKQAAKPKNSPIPQLQIGDIVVDRNGITRRVEVFDEDKGTLLGTGGWQCALELRHATEVEKNNFLALEIANGR